MSNFYGTSGNDTIVGSNGNDYLYGGNGNDYLYGGNGNDFLDGGFGYDTISGGAGVDTTSYTFYSGPINANLLTGVVEFPGNSALTDTLINIENLIGTAGNDTITGSNANNSLFGGNGNDYLNGCVGKDTLTGGKGKDIFDFNKLNEMGLSENTRDIITDFTYGQDKIDLSTLDANQAMKGNQTFFAPVVGGAFSGAFANPGDLYFDKETHVLYGNTDADSQPEFSIQLTGVTIFDASDLIL